MTFFKGKHCKCAICNNYIILNGKITKSIIHTSCNHYFCHNCLKQWLYIKKNCPLCRKNFIEHVGFLLEINNKI